ncbi:MAG: hypothetical protein ACAI38_13940 [Myxococcota bacterium]
MATAADFVSLAHQAIGSRELAPAAGNVSRVEYSRLQQAWHEAGPSGQMQVQMQRTFDAPFGQREAYLKLIDALRARQPFDAYQQSLVR